MDDRRRRATRSWAVGLAGVLAAGLLAPATTSASAAAAEDAPERLLPNLRVLPARDVHITRNGTLRKLRFESALANVGDGPMEVRPNQNRECPEGRHHASQIFYRDVNRNGVYDVPKDTQLARRPAGCMVFHPFHDHWHFEAASRYALYAARRPDTTLVGRRKMSFCLRDSRRVPPRMGTYGYAESYGACSRTSPQGISVGWVDVYQSFLAGQAITLPARVGDGLYCLRITVDPRDQLLETDERDNSSVRAFAIRGDRVRYRDSARCR